MLRRPVESAAQSDVFPSEEAMSAMVGLADARFSAHDQPFAQRPETASMIRGRDASTGNTKCVALGRCLHSIYMSEPCAKPGYPKR